MMLTRRAALASLAASTLAFRSQAQGGFVLDAAVEAVRDQRTADRPARARMGAPVGDAGHPRLRHHQRPKLKLGTSGRQSCEPGLRSPYTKHDSHGGDRRAKRPSMRRLLAQRPPMPGIRAAKSRRQPRILRGDVLRLWRRRRACSVRCRGALSGK
jgi:hypothetical protein